MEKFTGILIATTNITHNFDSAFERRFLFKIEFEKPTAETTQKIWQSKLEFLSEEDCSHLAKKYDFSGGQIDNIVRKCVMNDLLSGNPVRLCEIEELCKAEHFNKAKQARKIGFI